MNYLIETYGCEMNKAESQALESQLADRNWKKVTDPLLTDLVLINTCSVRITAENRAWGRIAHFVALKKKKPFVLIVTGCMAERLKDEMQKQSPEIDYVLGTFQKSAFELIIDATEKGQHLTKIEESPVFVFAQSHHCDEASSPDKKSSFSSYVPIMHGCNNFCSYCIVPYVRGREISRSPDDILKEIISLGKAGVKEVILLGQNVNSYNFENNGNNINFATLLRLIAPVAEANGIGRIRFVSSHPKDLSPETVDVIAENKIFARHIHLCVQNGSDSILKAMNRKYTSSDYLNLVKMIKNRIPELSLSTDILVGFPGETEDDLEKTLELMRQVRFSYAFMYHYNVREGTVAASLPGRIPLPEKIKRLSKVIALQTEIGQSIMQSLIGTDTIVLVESISKKNKEEVLGRSDSDMMVVFKGDSKLIGKFVQVRLLSVNGNTFKAELRS